MYLSVVCIEHTELEVIDRRHLVALGQMAELLHQDTANGVEVVFAQTRTKILVELLDFRQRLHQVTVSAVRPDIGILFGIVFVVDLSAAESEATESVDS